MIDLDKFKKLSIDQIDDMISELECVKEEHNTNILDGFTNRDISKIEPYLKLNDNNFKTYQISLAINALKIDFSIQDLPFLIECKKINQYNKLYHNLLRVKDVHEYVFDNLELINFFSQECPEVLSLTFKTSQHVIKNDIIIQKLIDINAISLKEKDIEEHKEKMILSSSYSEELISFFIKNKTIEFSNAEIEKIYINNMLNFSSNFSDLILKTYPFINKDTLNIYIEKTKNQLLVKNIIYSKNDPFSDLLLKHPINNYVLNYIINLFSQNLPCDFKFQDFINFIKNKQPELINSVLEHPSIEALKYKNDAYNSMILNLKITNNLQNKSTLLSKRAKI